MVDQIRTTGYPTKKEGDTNGQQSKTVSGTFPVVGIRPEGQIQVSQTTATDCRQAAGLLSGLSESAQEQIYLLTTDREANVLVLHKYSKGTMAEAAALINSMSGHVFKLSEAHTTYLCHNHPSGDLDPSPADRFTFSTLKNTLQIAGVDVKGIIVANNQFVEFDGDKWVSEPAMLPVGIKDKTLPVHERKIIGRKPHKPNKVLWGNSAIKRFKRSSDGILFTDIKARELGFVPFKKGSTRELATEILIKADELNAVNAFINFQTNENTNRGRLYASLAKALEGQGIVVRDIIGKDLKGRVYSFQKEKLLVDPDPQAIKNLDSDEPLYATTSDFPKCYDMIPGEGLSLKDIQERFKGQKIFKGDDGSLSIHFANGMGARINFIEHISPEEKRMMIDSGRMSESGSFLGKTDQNEVYLHAELATTWARDHEFGHLLKNLGMITDDELDVLDQQIEAWVTSDKLRFHPQRDPRDNQAHALAQILEDRKAQRETKVGQMVQKVSDFFDGLTHIGKSSARKLARQIETGQIFQRPAGKNTMKERIGPAEAAIERDIALHQQQAAQLVENLQTDWELLEQELAELAQIGECLDNYEIVLQDHSASFGPSIG